MKDIEYLKEAVAKRYLCPKCGRDYLKFEKEIGAVCPTCGENFNSWASLFLITASHMNWGSERAWRKWLEAHPDYNK